jgi:hypothetical protein
MRSVWLAASIAIAMLSTAAAQRVAPRRNPQLLELAGEAEAADPEFSADILIRAAAAAGATDRSWARELLEEAFVRAYAAQEPYRRVAPPLPADTRQYAEALAADTPLDTVSLQLRAVQLMRMIDPLHARDMFEWISMPLEPGTCESALVPSVDDYYTALVALARDTFPRTPAGRADALRFLEFHLWRARLPSELPAVAKAIERLPRTREEAAYFEAVLRMLLLTAEKDTRGFAISGLDVVGRFAQLEAADARLGIVGSHLTDALRHLLVNQMRPARCADSVAEASIVDAFNANVLRREAIYDGVALLSNTDVQPGKMLGALKIDPLWQTFDARRLHDSAIDLRGPGEKPVSMRIRQTADWLHRAERHLADIDQWSGMREAAERDYFFEKGVLYIGLVELVPHGALRKHVLRSFVEFLRHSDAERRRQLWFAVASRLIELARSDDAPDLIPIMESSGHPALALYAHAALVFAH